MHIYLKMVPPPHLRMKMVPLENEDGPRDGRVGDTKPTKGYAQPGSDGAGAHSLGRHTRNDKAVSCGDLSPNGEVQSTVGPSLLRAHTCVRRGRP